MEISDIHTHIMYDVDDGSRDLDMSLELIRMSYVAGIHTIILTPHFGPKAKKARDIELLRGRTKELEDLARKRIDDKIRIYLGQELYYREDIVEKLKSGEAITINDTKYVLVEFGVGDSYSRIKRAVQNLQYAGYRPIIAHVERYGEVFKKKEYLEELIHLGAYLQLNGNCLQGGIFDREAAYCRKLFNEHMIHFIASDCHRVDWREPMTKEQVEFFKRKLDQGRLQQVLCEYPKRMLEGQYI